MKKLKKLLSVVLAVAMVATLVPALPAKAAGELEGQIVILHTNDVHGAIEGYAKVAYQKKKLESQGATVLLMDAGDFAQGAVSVSESKGMAAVELMNLAGYDVATMGNHELDYGFDNVLKLKEAMKFDFVVSTLSKDGKLVFDANKIYETADGVKIGVFGLNTPETKTKTNPRLSQGLSFVTGKELAKTAQAQVDELKKAGCDLIICLSHLGIDEESKGNQSLDVLEAVTGIDLLIDGHSHTQMEKLQEAAKARGITTVVTSTGSKLSNLGEVFITMKDGKADIQTACFVLEDTKEDDEVDEKVAAKVKEINDQIDAKLGQVIGKTEVRLAGEKPEVRAAEANSGDLITDAMIWALKQQDIVVDGAFTNGGGIRATIEAGDITAKDIKTVLPFGNTLAVVNITGAELLEALEASTYAMPEPLGGFPQVAGIEFTVNTGIPYDEGEAYPDSEYNKPKSIGRVTISKVGGKDFSREAVYSLATNDFLYSGGDTYYAIKAAEDKYDTGIDLADVVIDYIQNGLKGVVTEASYGKSQGRITIIDEPVMPIAETESEIVPEVKPEDETVVDTPAPVPAGSYVVVKGDSLWKIAKAKYNDGNKYILIFNANKDKIKDANKISIGQVLNLPEVA